MAEVPFKVYPRGFLGAMLEDRVEKHTQTRDSILAGLQNYQVRIFGKQNDVDHSNPNVEALYAQYIRRAPDTQSFEFRKKVLIVALHAFGTRQFDFWYHMQCKSPMVGDLHQRFLEDTLRFIATGRRELALETWNALVTVDDTGDHSGQLSLFAREFFGMGRDGTSSATCNTAIVDVIQQWCGFPNGMEDLLGTLHLLFGNE